MTTPLQQAAKDIVERWDSPGWKDVMPTAGYIAELRKALDIELAQTETGDRNLRVTELAQSVEPVAWIVYVAEVQNQYVVDDIDDANLVDDCTNHGAEVTPLYLHPPQPQATTPAVPEGYALVPIEPTDEELAKGVRAMSLFVTKNSLIDFSLGYKAMLTAAQGEKK